jgi:hypothetical protein
MGLADAARALLAILLAVPAAGPPAAASDVAASPAHVMVIVEENRNETAVIGAADAPFINALAAQYGFATRSYAAAHPSLPNYLELIAGDTLGVADDGTGYTPSAASAPTWRRAPRLPSNG